MSNFDDFISDEQSFNKIIPGDLFAQDFAMNTNTSAQFAFLKLSAF